MKRVWLGVGAVAFVMLAGMFAIGVMSWEPESETIDLGPGPLARLNRLLALERYLEQRFGCQVDGRFAANYGDDEALYDLIILPVEALPLHGDAWDELEYLCAEDALVITGFGDYSPDGQLPSQYETPSVLARIGVEALNPAKDGVQKGVSGTAAFGDYAFVSYYEPEFQYQPDPEAPYGTASGVVTLHALNVFANDQIGEQDHVALLETLVAPLELNEYSQVLVVHGRQVASLWSWLAGDGLPVVVLTVLMVGLVIWHYGPRFGPLLPELERGSRELREHFLATSRYFWRDGATLQLLTPARRPLLESLRRRGGGAGEAELAALGAKLSGLRQDEVQHALFSRQINKESLVQVTRVLQTLRQNL